MTKINLNKLDTRTCNSKDVYNTQEEVINNFKVNERRIMYENILILEKKLKLYEDFYNNCRKINKIDEISLKEYLCDILSWSEICLKSINMKELTKVEKEKIIGFKYINNIKKHSISMFKFNLNTYYLYPSDDLYPSDNLFPSDFGIFWNTLPLDNKKYKNPFIKFNRHFKNKNINSGLSEIYEIIKAHTR